MSALLRLYPRAWRERYGDEFLAAIDGRSLHAAQVFDIVFGAIDAWLSADVRQTTRTSRVVASEGGQMTAISRMFCEQRPSGGVTVRDGLTGAAVMLGASWVLKGLALAARSRGFAATGDALTNFSFVGPFTLSMPLWLLKGQPWAAQLAIVGGTLALLVLVGLL